MKETEALFLLSILLIISVAQEYLSVILPSTSSGSVLRSNRFLLWSLVCTKIIWSVYSTASGLSMILFLSGMGGVCILIAFACGREQNYFWSRDMVLFLIYASTLLILVGFFSILKGQNVGQFMISLNNRAEILIGVNFILCLLALWNRKTPLNETDFDHDWKQDQLYHIFLFCCVVYVYCDAFFAFSVANNNIVAMLLITGNFLLLLLNVLFIRQKRLIAKRNILVEDYEKLSAELLREHLQKKQFELATVKDSLTQCYSRRYITEKIQNMQEMGHDFAIAFIDMDGLKAVNDKKGHDAGDRLLIEFSDRLRKRLGDDDLLARIGGDEFLLVLANCNQKEAKIRLEKIRAELSEAESGGEGIFFSFGIASGEQDVESLIQKADYEMYLDKRRVRGGVTGNE